MKVLKSGVELTPEELKEVRGGVSCACGCEGGYTSENLWTSSRDFGGCYCGCTTTGANLDAGISALNYPV